MRYLLVTGLALAITPLQAACRARLAHAAPTRTCAPRRHLLIDDAKHNERLATIKFVQALWMHKVAVKRYARVAGAEKKADDGDADGNTSGSSPLSRQSSQALLRHQVNYTESMIKASMALRKAHRARIQTQHQTSSVDPAIKNIEAQLSGLTGHVTRMNETLRVQRGSLSLAMPAFMCITLIIQCLGAVWTCCGNLF